jgi:hypothetical protein
LHFTESTLVDTAWVTGVTIVNLVFKLGASDAQFSTLTTTMKSPVSTCGVNSALCLPTQTTGDFRGQTTQHFVAGVNHVPIAFYFMRLGGESFHVNLFSIPNFEKVADFKPEHAMQSNN